MHQERTLPITMLVDDLNELRTIQEQDIYKRLRWCYESLKSILDS